MAATSQTPLTLVLHVINYAALSREVLDETMARVASVYKVIGVRTVWIESERSADQRQNSALHLSILLLSRDMADKKISLEGLKPSLAKNASLMLFPEGNALANSVSSGSSSREMHANPQEPLQNEV